MAWSATFCARVASFCIARSGEARHKWRTCEEVSLIVQRLFRIADFHSEAVLYPVDLDVASAPQDLTPALEGSHGPASVACEPLPSEYLAAEDQPCGAVLRGLPTHQPPEEPHGFPHFHFMLGRPQTVTDTRKKFRMCLGPLLRRGSRRGTRQSFDLTLLWWGAISLHVDRFFSEFPAPVLVSGRSAPKNYLSRVATSAIAAASASFSPCCMNNFLNLARMRACSRAVSYKSAGRFTTGRLVRDPTPELIGRHPNGIPEPN